MQNIITGKVHTAHVSRLKFYADSQLHVTANLKDVFQHSYNHGEFQMNAIIHVAAAEDSSIIVLVDWAGFDTEERTWEPLTQFEMPHCCLFSLNFVS